MASARTLQSVVESLGEPGGKFFPRPHAVRVVFGKPLNARELKREGRGEKPHQQIATALNQKVAELA